MLYQYFYTGELNNYWKSKEIENILKYLEREDPNFKRDLFIDIMNKLLAVDPN